jgi:choline dehydrogenase-like flavoprotein
VSELEKYDALVLGSGTGVKLIARTMASEGNRTASIERKSWRIIFPSVLLSKPEFVIDVIRATAKSVKAA